MSSFEMTIFKIISNLIMFLLLNPDNFRTRSNGSAALDMAMVAMGGADCYFEFGIHAWDYAAGDLLVREAGGVCLDPSGMFIPLLSPLIDHQGNSFFCDCSHWEWNFSTLGGPLDLLARRMLCAATMDLAQEMIPKISQIYPPRD